MNTNVAMAAPSKGRCYGVESLVELRSSLPYVKFDLSKLNKQLDIASIVRLPEQALLDPVNFTSSTTNLEQYHPRRSRQRSSRSGQLSEINSNNSIGSSRNKPTQWYLRQRDSSDRSSQPHSAPTGPVAQQSENFQRFYRAVVSPTHVRVTAGGRIVPNTRANAPALLEWNSEKLVFEPRNNENVIDIPQFSTPATQGYPLVLQPYQLAFPNASATMALDGAAESEQQPVKLSPPSQFDQSKPFMLNGQLVYPVPAGHPPPQGAMPMPIQMYGHPGMMQAQPGHPMPGVYAPPHFPMYMGNYPPQMMPHGSMPMMMPHSTQGFASHLPPYVAPSSSTVMSDFTKSQIQGLRNQLTLLEQDHVQKNPHFNKEYIESQRMAIKSNIDAMEGVLASQLVQEKAATEKAGLLIKQEVKISSDAAKKNEKHSAPAQPVTEEKATTQKAPVETAKPSFSVAPVTKSRLTAKAAPFLPRAHGMSFTTSHTSSQGIPNFSYLIPVSPLAETQAEVEDRLLANSTGIWTKTDAEYNTSPAYISYPKASSFHSHSVQSSPEHHSAVLRRTHTVHAPSYSMDSQLSGPIIAPNAHPYLVGMIPPYGKSYDAKKPVEYYYHRDLTQEEQEARMLYWGKAPRSARSGLPKFDGKDFYPASPVKEVVRPSTANSGLTPKANHSTLGPLNFDTLFTSPGNDAPSPTYYTATSSSHLRETSDKPCTTDQTNGGYNDVFMNREDASSELKIQLSKKDTSEDGGASLSPSKQGAVKKQDPVKPTIAVQASTSRAGPSFAERVANSSHDDRNKFLHDMLRHHAQLPTLDTPISGKISSVNAQAYLPRYPGAAVASLAPSMANVTASSSDGILPLTSRNLSKIPGPLLKTFENRPLYNDTFKPGTAPADAHSYLRFLYTKQSAEESDDGKDKWIGKTPGW